MNGTKIRPYFERRQAFLGPIVFGFCLGGGALLEGYKLKHANGLQVQQPTADHDEFAKKDETKPPSTGSTHFFPRRFGAQKFGEPPGVRKRRRRVSALES